MKRKIILVIVALISLALIPISGFAVINTAVSLKYETNSPEDCISLVSGQNLCAIISTFQIICLLSIITFLVSLNLLLIKRKSRN